jgi:Carboxypeptidase regulatory-like domain
LIEGESHVTISVTAYSQSPDESVHGGIDGVVVQLDGRPLANAMVYALPENEMNRPPIKTTSREDGSFSFRGLKSGEFYLDASKDDVGYIYSFFSFYITPGQNKPKVKVTDGQVQNNVIIQLGKKVAYLQMIIRNADKDENLNFIFTRPDLPQEGYYRTGAIANSLIPVPSVPFRLSIEANKHKTWKYLDTNGNDLLDLEPGEVKKIEVELNPIDS